MTQQGELTSIEWRKRGNGKYEADLPGEQTITIRRTYTSRTNFVWAIDGHTYPSKIQATRYIIHVWNSAIKELTEEQINYDNNVYWVDLLYRLELLAFYPAMRSMLYRWCEWMDRNDN